MALLSFFCLVVLVPCLQVLCYAPDPDVGDVNCTSGLEDNLSTVGSATAFPIATEITLNAIDLLANFPSPIPLYPSVTDTAATEKGSEDPDASPPNWAWYKLEWTWVTIVQVVCASFGIIGNLFVILVLFRKGATRRSTDCLVGNLAIADLLTSVFLIPIPSIRRVPNTALGLVYCKIVYTNLLMWVSVTNSVFILSALSVERFVAVAYPFRLKQLFSYRSTVKYIIGIWTSTIVQNILFTFLVIIDENNDSCMFNYASELARDFIGVSIFFFKFLNPTIVMLVTQAATAYSLHLASSHFSESVEGVDGDSAHRMKMFKAKKRVVQLLLTVVLTFVICWGPDQIFFLLLNLGLISTSHLYGPLYRILVVLAFLNSCLNPIIYTARHPRFRQTLKEVLLGSPQSKGPVFGFRGETKE